MCLFGINGLRNVLSRAETAVSKMSQVLPSESAGPHSMSTISCCTIPPHTRIPPPPPPPNESDCTVSQISSRNLSAARPADSLLCIWLSCSASHSHIRFY